MAATRKPKRSPKSGAAKKRLSKAPPSAPRFAESSFPMRNTESFRERNPRTLNRDEVRQRKVRGKD